MIKRIKILISLALLLSIVKTYGQGNTILPINWPYPTDSIQAMHGSASLLYIAHRDNSGPLDSINISTWDGSTWSNILVPNCNCSNFLVKDMAVYNNELYIAGEFNNISGIPNSTSIIKYTGTVWTDVDGGITASTPAFPNSIINHLEVFNNSLYAAGIFNSIGSSISAINIAKWNGTAWDSASSAAGAEIIELKQLNGKLYASLQSFSNGVLLEIDGSGTTVKTFPGTNQFISIALHNGNIYLRDTLTVYQLNGTNAVGRYFPKAIGGLPIDVSNLESYNGALYNFNDFNNSSAPFVSKYDNITWSESPVTFLGSSVNEIHKTAQFNDDLYIAGKYGTSTGGFNVGKLSTRTANLAGYVYEDNNSDCIKDANDNGQKNRMLEIFPGPYYAVTNDTGYYSIDLPDSVTYTITLLNDSIGLGKYWQNSACSSPIQTIAINRDTTTSFSIETAQSVVDLKVELTGSMSWRARQGFTQRYYIDITNIGTINSGQYSLKLLHDSLTYLSSSIVPNTVTPDSIDWTNFLALNSGQTTSLTIDFRVPTSSTVLGDAINFVAELYVNSDSDYNNNYDTLSQTVVAAVDPNDKQTNPTGTITLNQQYIDYQIRYQNTGSDTAIKVTVVDTVDSKLPLTSIVMQSLSHSYSIKVQNNAIIWTFDNIMLPHATSDSLGSIGYIKYRAYIAPGLAVGDTISNRADIYFDFQQLLKTNTVINWVPKPQSISENGNPNNMLKVYPNPASNKITLNYTGNDDKSFYIINSLGQKILAVDVRAHIPKTIDVSNLPAGLYFIRSTDSNIVFKLLVN